MAGDVILVAISLWALAIAASDVLRRKVPNTLLLLALVPALLALALNGQGLLGTTVGASSAGLLVAAALTLPGYVMNQMGAGDVKLAAVLGLLGGLGSLQWWLLFAALILGVMGLVAIILRRVLNRDWRKMPAGVALVAGFLGYFWWTRLVVGAVI